MSIQFAVSGSTIMSDPKLFDDLFWEDIKHIEIGEFEKEEDFQLFLQVCKQNNASFGVHSPLFRQDSKYDLIEKVVHEPAFAWKRLEEEAQRLSGLGAEYILVHFPYFKREIMDDPNKLIEEGLQKLSAIQDKYEIPIVCEPKLGLHRSPVGIEYLNQFSEETWSKFGLKLCIDIGDYRMAMGDKTLEYIMKWEEHITVAHIHNVTYEGDKYIWTPIHPSYEDNLYKFEPILKYLAQIRNLRFVFEHTPHTNPSKQFVREGYEWMQSTTQFGKVSGREDKKRADQ
ncbi:TIM barrel protein [Pseudalkalibacillus berkeleyi]|uniref:Sugar phosphate isomerase/epimerase n=1 Tax=Pseudalkalibacillus berkeleyi TaxID=1069813 RepID=A0ABS9GXT9_9BACL|nr:TIM barrel protein [Pseudalkalibacillus berkeleyi]MCF6136636.1 sugar phosphate isomerase/epimerase [Pseudalkalibacillus berkeleyi]